MGFFGGVKRLVKSPVTLVKASGIVKQAKEDFESAEAALEEERGELASLLEKLGEKKLEVLTETIPILEEAYGAIGDGFPWEGFRAGKNATLRFQGTDMPLLVHASGNAQELVGKAGMSGAAGLGGAAGAFGLVSLLGTASTGTAISTLSGAAATNATLAWFGGGALSAGGMGMAGGAVVLGGIALAPILVVGAFSFASFAERKMTAATEFRAEVDKAIEQMDAAMAVLKKMRQHYDLSLQTLNRLDEALKHQAKRLQALAKDDTSQVEDQRRAIGALGVLSEAVSRILKENLLTEDGEIPIDSLETLSHAHAVTNLGALESGIVASAFAEKSIPLIPPEALDGQGKLQPGKYSELFFWKYSSGATPDSILTDGFAVPSLLTSAILMILDIFFVPSAWMIALPASLAVLGPDTLACRATALLVTLAVGVLYLLLPWWIGLVLLVGALVLLGFDNKERS